MATLDVLVELGLDLGPNDPTSFTLDSPTKGVLDNTSFTLGGSKFYDITDRVIALSTDRGKSEALDRIDAGVASVVLNNSDRLFDPLNPNSIYFGQLVPRREIRVSSNDKAVIYGFIDDFDISYESDGMSTVRVELSDALSVFANNKLDFVSPPSELAGARINRILDLPEVAWPSDKREIDPGNSILLDSDIEEGTGTLDYLQLVESSEFGTLFLSKDGMVTFRERNAIPNLPDVVFTDDESLVGVTPVPFIDLRVVYGSENLYNRIILSNDDVIPEEVIAEDIDSQQLYGIRTYTQSGILVQEPSDLQGLADFLLFRFKEPQYRFEAITASFDVLDDTARDALLDLEIGDLVTVEFTPSGIPPTVTQNCRIIGINHDWSPAEKRVTFALERLDFGIFVLDNPSLGQLDDDRLSY